MDQELEDYRNRIRDMAQTLVSGLEYLCSTEARTRDAVHRLEAAAKQLDDARKLFEGHSVGLMQAVGQHLNGMPERVGEKVGGLIGDAVRSEAEAALSELRAAANEAAQGVTSLREGFRLEGDRLVRRALVVGASTGAAIGALVSVAGRQFGM